MVFISDRFELKDSWSPGFSAVFAHENNTAKCYLHTVSLIWDFCEERAGKEGSGSKSKGAKEGNMRKRHWKEK